MKSLPYISLLCLLLLAAACSKVPDYVVPPDDMAEVMADMYVARAVVDQNRIDFPSDSSRQVLKQSILARRGLTQQDFDTSLVWYGHNAALYEKVFDKTVEILEKRNEDAGAEMRISARALGGDSVEMWTAAPYVTITDRMPSRLVSFDLPVDTTAQRGDYYTWRFKLVGKTHQEVVWNMFAEYADSVGEWLWVRYTPSDMAGDWNQMIFPTDSTRTLVRLRGYFDVNVVDGARDVCVDSISLIRKAVNPEVYSHRYRVRSHRLY